VCNGRNIQIWWDAWIPNEPNFKPRLRIGAKPKYQYVSDLILHDSRQWDKGKLNEIFHQETIKNILQIHPPIISKEDSFIWATNSARSFSIKSTYLTDQKHRFDFSGPLTNNEWLALWNSKIHNRLKLLLWKLALGMLPVNEVLIHRFPISERECFLCNEHLETLEHLFMECPIVEQVWALSPMPLLIHKFRGRPMSQWVKMMVKPEIVLGINGEKTKDFTLLAALTCDIIWMERNRIRIDGGHADPMLISSKVSRSFKEHKSAWQSISSSIY
jgi:hypothetical protein